MIGVFDDAQVGAPMVGAYGYGGLRQDVMDTRRSYLEQRVADLPDDVHAESAFLVALFGATAEAAH